MRPLTIPRERPELSVEEMRQMRQMEATGEVSNFTSTPRDQTVPTGGRSQFSRIV